MTARPSCVAALLTAALLLTYAGCPAPPEAGVDEIAWITSFPEALAAAQAAQKPLLIDFTADWCGFCHMLAEQSFPHPRIQALKDALVWARIDAEREEALFVKYQVQGLPTLVMVDGEGREITRLRGFVDGKNLANFIEQGLTKSRLLRPGSG